MNFPCDNDNPGFVQENKTFTSLNIICSNELIVGDRSTYINNSLGYRSSLDHFFVSSKIKRDLVSLQILHSGANLSDHLPVVAKFNWSVARLEPGNGKKNNSFRLQWDKCNVSDYYSVVYDALNQIVLLSCCFGPDGYDSFSDIYADINVYYQNIVNALSFAEQQTVPRILHSALKAYWSDELDSLEEKSVFWQKIWESAGCPKGLLLHIKTKAKLNFKVAVKQAAVNFENSHCDDMYQHFLNKNMPDFWKSWSLEERL